MPIGTSGKRLLQPQGETLCADEPRRLAGRGACAHRERRVEEDERLRVGALAHELLPDDDRLRGGNCDERGKEDERDHHGDDRPAARAVQRQETAHALGAALGEQEREERRGRGEHEDRVERRQKRHAEDGEHQ